MTKPSVPATALLPIRLFFGATFLYAGLDKLVLDPSFFDASAPTSLHAQLVSFARFSPLGPLIEATLPFATVIGLLFAVAEVAVGIGALTGLAFRIAAAAGAGLSFLLYLTASWATKPYYLGPDLPYAVGWVALALAGHGDVWIPSWVRNFGMPSEEPSPELTRRAAGRARRAARRRARGLAPEPVQTRAAGSAPDMPPSPERRLLLETGLLAALTAILTSLALPLRAFGLVAEAPSSSPAPSGSGPLPTGSGGASQGTGGLVVARISDVTAGGGSAAFTIPFNAPSPLPAGDPGIIVQLASGTFVAFDAICTHAGCTVEWDQPDALIVCPCHSAAFDPAHGAQVVSGPAPTPLTSLPIVVDQATGAISLAP